MTLAHVMGMPCRGERAGARAGRRSDRLGPRGRREVYGRGVRRLAAGARMTTMPATAGRAEQTRARYPDDEGYVERDGVRVFYEVYGSGEPTILLCPPGRSSTRGTGRCRSRTSPATPACVTFDRRGNGRSDRPAGRRGLRRAEFAADALAVLDAAGTEHAVVVGLSAGALWGAAARRRASRAGRRPRCSSAAAAAVRAEHAARASTSVRRAARDRRGLGEVQPPLLAARTTATSSSSSSAQVFTEPHSTKQIEDCVGWGLETTPETLAADLSRPPAARPADVHAASASASRAPCW